MAAIPLSRHQAPLNEVALVDDELFGFVQAVGQRWCVDENRAPYKVLKGFQGFQYNLKLNRLCFALGMCVPERRLELVQNPQEMYKATTLKGGWDEQGKPCQPAFGRLTHRNGNKLDCRMTNLIEHRVVAGIVPLLGSQEAENSPFLQQATHAMWVQKRKKEILEALEILSKTGGSPVEAGKLADELNKLDPQPVEPEPPKEPAKSVEEQLKEYARKVREGPAEDQVRKEGK